MKRSFRNLRAGWWLMAPAMSALSASWGCVGPQAPQSKGMTHDELAAFRTDAIKALEDAAFSDDPAGRMQALEAFAEVAPREGLALQAIPLNLENAYPGASFAALMAAGEIGADYLIDIVRTRAEHADPNVRLAAIFALHKFGDRSRTGEIANYLLSHPDAKVRANAALVLGRIGGKQQIKLLKTALRREQKDLPRLQILEALATLGDRYGTERLIFEGYSEIPQQSAIALMMLANARAEAAEELFWFRMQSAKWPEVQLQAVRGLARRGHPQGRNHAVRSLFFNAPRTDIPNDPPEQQVRRVRGLAALALEAVGDPGTLVYLRKAFDEPNQSRYVKIATARAAVRIIDLCRPELADDAAPILPKRRSPDPLVGDMGREEP
ncbi:MAG: HEAT repeat domain-containing protein [Phycisphaerae bacterium]|nr:HEAT repeat domain-containing protein [Phycisphaerae bacterium]